MIFDLSEDTATARFLAAIDESVWESVQIPRRHRAAAARKIAKTLDAFLSTSLTGLVSAALENYRELVRYADGKDHTVATSLLRIESEHEPYVDLRVMGLDPTPVRFPLSVSLEFSSATLIISRDRLVAMRTGTCVASGTLRCESAEVFSRPAAPLRMRSELQFNDGIPLLGPATERQSGG